MANLIDVWNAAPSGDEITLLGKLGEERVKVIKRGSFAGTVRKLTEVIPEEEILSDRWRWRIK